MADQTLMPDGNGKPTPIGNFAHITSTAAALIKTGSGFLYSVTFNTPTAAGTLELDDAITNANPIAIVKGNTVPYTLQFNIAFSNGLYVVPGGAAQDITISYR